MADTQDLEPLLQTRQNQLMFLFAGSDSLDTKALGVIAFNAALAIFTIQSLMDTTHWLLVPLFLAFSISTLASVRIIWPRDYIGAGVDLSKHPEYLGLPRKDLVLQLLADTEKAIQLNAPINAMKSRFIIFALLTSLAGIILLVGCIL